MDIVKYMKINIFKHTFCYSEQTVYIGNYLCTRFFINCDKAQQITGH